MFLEIKNDIAQQNYKLEEMEKNINNNIDGKFLKYDQKYDLLEEKLEAQEKRLDFYERQTKRKNIMIFGLIETEKKYQDLEKLVTEFIKENLRITCTENDIEYVTRIGKRGNEKRPICVTLTTFGKKLNIMRNKKYLDGTEVYIKEDFPQKVLLKRKELQEQAELERQKGKKVFFKYDKIIILDNDNNTASSIKRKHTALSPPPVTSPSTANPTSEIKSKQANKKCKMEGQKITKFINLAKEVQQGPNTSDKPEISKFINPASISQTDSQN